jgi:cobalt-zinc-cadmium efflux system outer membrane protein
MPADNELYDLINLALMNNPVIVASRAQVNESLGLQQQASLYPNPSISVVHQEIGNNGSSGQHGVAWNKPVVRSRRIENRTAVATSNVSIAELNLQVTEQRLANQVRRGYFLVRLAQMRCDAFRQLSKSSNEITSAVRELVEVGELARTSLFQAELAAENVLAQFMAAETSLPAIRQSLAALTNTESEQFLRLASLQGAVEAAVPDYSWEEAVARLRNENLQLCIQQLKIHRAGNDVALQQSLQNPDWSVQFSVYYDDDSNDSFGGVSVTRPVQLRDWNQGNVRAAHARRSNAANSYGALELAARSALAEAFQRYLSARQRMTRFRDNIIPKAQQSLELVSAALSEGEATYLEALTSQQQFISAFSTYLNLLADCIESSIQVENVITGVSGPQS